MKTLIFKPDSGTTALVRAAKHLGYNTVVSTHRNFLYNCQKAPEAVIVEKPNEPLADVLLGVDKAAVVDFFRADVSFVGNYDSKLFPELLKELVKQEKHHFRIYSETGTEFVENLGGLECKQDYLDVYVSSAEIVTNDPQVAADASYIKGRSVQCLGVGQVKCEKTAIEWLRDTLGDAA